MFAAAVLIAVTSSSLWAGQMPGGNPPRGMERERVRTAAPPPSSPELRKLEGLRARFDFASESNNQASLEVLDKDLLATLLQIEGPLDAPGGDAGVTPDGESESQPLTRAVLQVRGRYDALALKVRRTVLNTLLAKAIQDAAANEPPREDAPPQQEPPQRGRGRRR